MAQAQVRVSSIYVDPELANLLKAEQERTGAPQSEIIRRALRAYLPKEQQPAKPAKQPAKPARENERMDEPTITMQDTNDGSTHTLPVLYSDGAWSIVYDPANDWIQDGNLAAVHADLPLNQYNLHHLQQQANGEWQHLDDIEELTDGNPATAHRAAEVIADAVGGGRLRVFGAVYGLPGASPLGALVL